MSRYVQRCQGKYCGGRVMGMTSFRTLGAGVRSAVCRGCESADREAIRRSKKRIASRRLVERIAAIDAKISTARARIGRLEKQRLRLTLEMGVRVEQQAAS